MAGNQFNDLRQRVDEETFNDVARALGLFAGSGLRCPYPDHPDQVPSAGLLPVSDGWLFNCRGCKAAGRGTRAGDVVKFVKVALDLPNMTLAAERLAAWLDGDAPLGEAAPPSSPSTQQSQRVDEAERRRRMQFRVKAAQWDADGAVGLVRVLFQERGWDVPARWLVRQYRLGTLNDGAWRLVMPYVRAGGRRVVGAGSRRRVSRPVRDEHGRVVGSEPNGWKQCDLDGSRHRTRLTLFGEHRLRDQPWVVLCEGETDTLAVAAAIKNGARRAGKIVVLGIPDAGCKPTPRLLRLLAGRRVVLMADRDDREGQGLRCAATWSAALRQGGAKAVSIARLRPEHDACSAGRRAVLVALRAAARNEGQGDAAGPPDAPSLPPAASR